MKAPNLARTQLILDALPEDALVAVVVSRNEEGVPLIEYNEPDDIAPLPRREAAQLFKCLAKLLTGQAAALDREADTESGPPRP